MKDFCMSYKLIMTITIYLFSFFIDFLQASEDSKYARLQECENEDGFVVITHETTPLLHASKNVVEDDAVERNNVIHQIILSHLDEHGVDDRTDNVIECLHCCCSLFKNCFGDKK